MASTQTFSQMQPNWVTPQEGLGMATLCISVVLGAFSTILVVLRTWIRVQTGTYGLDDGLMVIGLFVFLACCVMTCMACYAGLGTHDVYLETWNQHAGIEYIVYFQITYAWSLPFIKSSICLTMLRIITETKYRVTLWVSLASSVASALIGFVCVVALCTPLQYYWDQSIKDGWCASSEIITGMSYVISVLSIITDWACALVPCFVVWNLQMKSRLKASVCAVLALGMVASAATIVRLPYLQYYNVPANYLYNVANIVVWSIIECGIGIICGSMPSLRSLLKTWLEKSTNDDSYGNNSYPLEGRSGNRGQGANPESVKMGYVSHRVTGGYSTKISAPPRTQGDWVELTDDTESQKRMITVETSVDVEVERGAISRG